MTYNEELEYYLEESSYIDKILTNVNLKFKQFISYASKSKPNIKNLKNIDPKQLISHFGIKKLDDNKVRYTSLINDIKISLSSFIKKIQKVKLNKIKFKDIYNICESSLSPISSRFNKKESTLLFITIAIPILFMLIIIFGYYQLGIHINFFIIDKLFVNIFIILSLIILLYDSAQIALLNKKLNQTKDKLEDALEKIENENVGIYNILYIAAFSLLSVFFITLAIISNPTIKAVFDISLSITILFGSVWIFVNTIKEIKNTPKLLKTLATSIFQHKKEEEKNKEEIETNNQSEEPTKKEKEPEININII